MSMSVWKYMYDEVSYVSGKRVLMRVVHGSFTGSLSSVLCNESTGLLF